ncbi:uncharacterized protein METZ01_LOCUS228438 [marine metagenome]|uniref:Uncharacterized protein n=1 Tax=marine metagenome TaxID=408172 RepID=A0A382GLB7_9ZZZZ
MQLTLPADWHRSVWLTESPHLILIPWFTASV